MYGSCKVGKDMIFKYHILCKMESKVFILLVEGYNNRQIAEKLFISRSTVETHRKNIKRKIRDNKRYEKKTSI